MEMKTNLLIQVILCIALFLSIFLLVRSNSEAEKELESGEKKK